MGETKNSEVLESFINYCKENPSQRFWQALRNWSGYPYILASKQFPPIQLEMHDTFYWENKNGRG